MSTSSRSAIVVGLCAHGLDLVRALALQGVRVHAIEAKAERPGVATRLATVHLVDEINGPPLVGSLLILLESLKEPEPPVLLLTNDKMVFTIAENWDLLEGKVELSWASCREQVPTFLLKEQLPGLCARAGLLYPKCVVADELANEDLQRLLGELEFPLMVKPVKPMATFKAALVQSATELAWHFDNYRRDLPFVVQQWIPGDVTSLKFCALYLDAGKPLASFVGRKLDTLPRGLGTTTAAEGIEDSRLFDATIRFFEGHHLSGPVSLEFKEDARGNLWVIEPTAFRTDYWAGCCISNGVNLPLYEYLAQSEWSIPVLPSEKRRIWVDLERNPLTLFAVARLRPHVLLTPWRVSFTYLSLQDPRPFRALVSQLLSWVRLSLLRRARVSFRGLFAAPKQLQSSGSEKPRRVT